MIPALLTRGAHQEFTEKHPEIELSFPARKGTKGSLGPVGSEALGTPA